MTDLRAKLEQTFAMTAFYHCKPKVVDVPMFSPMEGGGISLLQLGQHKTERSPRFARDDKGRRVGWRQRAFVGTHVGIAYPPQHKKIDSSTLKIEGRCNMAGNHRGLWWVGYFDV